jgi:hypothetical protein
MPMGEIPQMKWNKKQSYDPEKEKRLREFLKDIEKRMKEKKSKKGKNK